MQKRIVDAACIILITLGLSMAAKGIMDLWIFQLTFPETMALEDVHWEDFSMKLRTSQKSYEGAIVLVNIGNDSRREIAEQVFALNRYNPKVIGIDAFFNCAKGKRDTINCPQLKDTLGNAMLSTAIKESRNFVMVSVLLQTPKVASLAEEVFDSLELSDESFMRYAKQGYGNMLVEGEERQSLDNVLISSIRKMVPKVTVNGERELAFAVETARLYDPVQTEQFLNRNNEEEWISYRGSASQYKYILGSKEILKRPFFRTIDRDSLVGGFYPRNVFENKIVLMGFLGNYLNDPTMESRFYTPMNTTFAGRSMPDMMGVEMHANIVSMILNKDFIDEVSPFWNVSATLLVFLLNVLVFIHLHKNQTTWYDSLCFIIPVAQVLFFSWLRLELFSSFSLRIELEGIIYMVAFVSFAVNLYYGPVYSLVRKVKARRKLVGNS